MYKAKIEEVVSLKIYFCSNITQKMPAKFFEYFMESTRKIIEINEELCDGCGLCLLKCMENALTIENGKAKVISDVLCDGLGSCLAACPQNALSIIEREALPFDINVVRLLHEKTFSEKNKESFGCPSLKNGGYTSKPWPIKLRILPANSPFLQNAPWLLVADCAPAVYTNFHAQHGNKIKIMACPKFEDHELLLQKLTEILTENTPQSLEVLRMEVPCCSALQSITNAAIKAVQEKTTQSLPFPKYEVCNRDGQILRDVL